LIELTDLPNNWIRTTIKETCSIMSGQTPKGIEDISGDIDEIPWFRVSDMNTSGNEKILTIAQVYLSQISIEKLGIHIRPKGTIVFPKRGGAIATNKKRILKTNSAYDLNIMGILPILIENRFFWHWFQTVDLKKISDGSNVPQINNGNIEPLEFPLPPLNEQRRIVSTIEQLTDRSNKARAALEDVPKLIAQFRQSVLAAAFRGDLTADWRERNLDVEPASELLERIKIDRRKRWEKSSKSQYKPPQDIETARLPKLPESWSWGSLDQLLYSLRNGLSRKPADEMPGIPILRISALRSMNLDTDDIRFYRPQDNENLESYFLDEGDLLFTRYNGNREFVGVCGRVNQISGKLLHPDKLIRGRVISGDLFDSHFLEIVCNSGISKKHIESYVKTSAGQHGISGSDLKTTPIPIPPIYEQRKIVEIVTMQLSTIKSIEDIAASYFIDSQQLDRSILAKAFRGELVPQDPNDEPAAVLLDRIRAEREQTSTPKQRGKTTRKNSSKQLSIDLE
jgi:type I restriction enzyme, S subunit